ncbi:Aldolase-type TIM barrel [Penicillium italicum]|uniref:sn-1-specific diacylglycerol lipase n=1 Tax=Penicillium italicum TaxID=40296 RepID=A0A0A2KPR6_PENIT|nr:Aldolase-type TIM barrel [Penicillium italicum]
MDYNNCYLSFGVSNATVFFNAAPELSTIKDELHMGSSLEAVLLLSTFVLTYCLGPLKKHKKHGGNGKSGFKSSSHVPRLDPRPGRSVAVRMGSAGRHALIVPELGIALFACAAMVLFQFTSAYLFEAFAFYAASATGAVYILRGSPGFGFPLFVHLHITGDIAVRRPSFGFGFSNLPIINNLQQFMMSDNYGSHQMEIYGKGAILPGAFAQIGAGGAGERVTMDKADIIPRMMRNGNTPEQDISVELFGQKYDNPLVVVPVGVQEVCEKVGVQYTMSTASTSSIEDVATANKDGTRWDFNMWKMLRLALKHGCDGIVVSNHGGRQVDSAIGSLDLFPEIVDAVGDKMTVLFDPGIRKGSDVIKAPCLGAEAVLVGRPVICGLSIQGRNGASQGSFGQFVAENGWDTNVYNIRMDNTVKTNDQEKPDDVDMNLDFAHAHVPASGSTLLPQPVASLISLITQSTSLSLRLGTFFGGAALDGARATTLTSLELSRALVEGILTRAGRDVAIRSGDEHGRTEAESLLERSLATLHTTVTSASFFAATTFDFSSTTLSSVANLSQALLSTLDAILGSTESSRAIAAIITLIRREFRSVEPGASTQNIGVGDLLLGSIGFALLQRWGKKNTERNLRQNGGDEIVWDVVILDNGVRADVIGSHQLQFPSGNDEELVEPSSASFVMPGKDEEAFDVVRRSSASDSFGHRLSIPLDGQHQVSDEDIRAYVMSQLPQGCHASIRSEVLTARTITVDIYDDDMAEIAAPPGTKMIEERFHHDHDYDHGDTNTADGQGQFPKHTVVFRTAFNKSQSTQLRPYDGSGNSALPEPNHHKRALSANALSNSPMKSRRDQWRSHPDATQGIAPKRRGTTPNSPNEPVKSALDKSTLAKLSQKVKPAVLEENEAKRPPGMKQPIDSSGLSGIQSPPLPPRPTKGTASVKEVTEREAFSRPALKKRQTEPVNYRPTTPVPNRGLRRSPFPNTLQRQSTQSQTKHTPSHEMHVSEGSRGGHFAVQEKSQESLLTQTDTFLSRHSASMRSGSPAAVQTQVRSNSSMSVTRSEADGTLSANDNRPGSSAMHRRSQSYTPSLYSLATARSETSLLLAHRPRKSAYEDMETIEALNRDGFVPGIFPERHFVHNIRRYSRFSSASYGSNALKVMGVPRDSKNIHNTRSDSHEHSAFSENAGLPPSTILLSSFVDPAGGSNAAGETETGFPLVHYLSIDHDSKAVVLTLRGTWGFEDILTDMTCDYDDLKWQGKRWKVHKGMHASAKRLLEGGGGRVMITLRAALQEFQDYGIVLCGHSLGGGVAALLATMISEPNPSTTGPSFVTASYQPASRPRLLTADRDRSLNTPHPSLPTYTLPSNRPIHVYAYGPPAVMCPSLRLATRGLVTTIVNGSDIVPSLSLGILHDLHTASLSFKDDATGAKAHIRQRVSDSLRQSVIHKFYVNQPPLVVNAGDGVGEDAWAWKTLKLLRAEMRAPKLVPPGEVFVVETMRVLQRDAFTAPELGVDGHPRLGRPATRVQIRFIRDVDAWFGELRFAGGMLSDHNPARYETSLAALVRGVLDE